MQGCETQIDSLSDCLKNEPPPVGVYHMYINHHMDFTSPFRPKPRFELQLD